MKKRLLLFVSLCIYIVWAGGGLIQGATNSKTKKSTNAQEVLQKGREAFLDYDFEEANDLFEQYVALKKRAKQPLDEDFEQLQNQLNIASNAFERVQKIVIIDSITVARDSFYKAYKLASSAGAIGLSEEFNLKELGIGDEVGFINEKKDYFISAVPNEDNEIRLMENRKLLDGTWITNPMLTGNFDKSGDYKFPFLSGDGQTFYFANNGPESMGGYDLFVVQKEPINGNCLQPLNLGMPFNSPYNDFMLVIDEETGVGWWATDRNSLGEDITIYIYLLDDVRQNYPPDSENLVEYAKVADVKATWDAGKGEEYQKILNSLSSLRE